MYRRCSTEESVSRQRQIEHCLLELMQTVPYAQITVGDICQKAGLSRKSFYRYFGSKEGCLYGLIDHCILDSSTAYLTGNDLSDSPRSFFEPYFGYWKQMRPLLEALCQNGLAPCLYERSLLCVTQEETEFRNILSSGNHDDGEERLLFIVCGIVAMVINWHMAGYHKSPAQMAQTLDRLLAQALLGNSEDN